MTSYDDVASICLCSDECLLKILFLRLLHILQSTKGFFSLLSCQLGYKSLVASGEENRRDCVTCAGPWSTGKEDSSALLSKIRNICSWPTGLENITVPFLSELVLSMVCCPTVSFSSILYLYC